MGLRTTCIGAYPKPSYVKLPDWFNIPAGPDTADPTKQWLKAMEELGPDANTIIAQGIKEKAVSLRGLEVGAIIYQKFVKNNDARSYDRIRYQ